MANPALVMLWQAVDENSPAYQAGRTTVTIIIAVVVIVVVYTLLKKSKK